MKFFINDICGYVGSSLLRELDGEGHDIMGSVKNKAEMMMVTKSSHTGAFRGKVWAVVQPNEASSDYERNSFDCALKLRDVVVCSLFGEGATKLAPLIANAMTSDTSETSYKINFEQAERRGSDSVQTKVLVCVSSLLTWGRTPTQADKVFSAADFTTRRPVPKYADWRALENQFMQLGSEGGLQSFVVGSGLLYGHGTLELSQVFKRAWMYPNDPLCLPCTERNGTGSNFLPCIHVDDLSVVVQQFANTAGGELPGGTQYVVATDGAPVTMSDICTAVSSALANGEVRLPAWDEVDDLALEDIHAAALQSNMKFERGVLTEGQQDLVGSLWANVKYPDGLVAHIKEVAQEYIKAEELRPLRLLVIAAPGQQLEDFESQACAKFHLPRVNLSICCEDVITQGDTIKLALKTKLEADGQAVPEDPAPGKKGKGKGPTWASLASNDADAALLTLHEEVAGVGGDVSLLKPEVSVKVVTRYLRRQECLNHGYVLTMIPNTPNWAESMFGVEVPVEDPAAATEDTTDGAAATAAAAAVDKFDAAICPTKVLIFDGDDEQLKEANTAAATAKDPEIDAKALSALDSDFKKKLQAFRDVNGGPGVGGDTALKKEPFLEFLTQCFGEQGKQQIQSFTVAGVLSESQLEEALSENTLPKTINFRPTRMERIAQRRALLEKQREAMESKSAGGGSPRDGKDGTEQNGSEGDDGMDLRSIMLQEHAALNDRSGAMIEYLLQNVVPTLTEGMLDVVKLEPEDPIDHLAEFLLQKADEWDAAQKVAEDLAKAV
jgi:adenylate kinase